jgi:hypothetical protein
MHQYRRPEQLQVEWIKCEGTQWCNLLTLNLNHPHFIGFEGVYIIWHGGQNPWAVYVGQGTIAQRLAEHRQDPRILQYSPRGLFVTWARVDASSRDGVERFLAEKLQPREGDKYPNANPIVVNLPW